MHILYKPGPELYIVDWLSHHNHVKNQDQKILGMNMSIHNISILAEVPACTSTENIQAAMQKDSELQILWRYIINVWPLTREAVEQSVEKYWLIRHELTMIDHIVMKAKHIIILVYCRGRSWNSCIATTLALPKHAYLQENQYTRSTWMLTLSRLWRNALCVLNISAYSHIKLQYTTVYHANHWK